MGCPRKSLAKKAVLLFLFFFKCGLARGQKMDLTGSQGSIQSCDFPNKYLSKCDYIFHSGKVLCFQDGLPAIF